jgi:glutamyl-tRNA synthetase
MLMPEKQKNEAKIKDNKNIRVRFAPSPTGFLHIGSARTAFFNWLFARKNNGKLILRMEDTDISRHREETIDLILGSLKWLGIEWDEGPDIGGNYAPYRQSLRLGIYKEYANKLVKEGKAYFCFCSPEKLEEKRKKAAANQDFYNYDRECLQLSTKEIKQNIDSRVEHTIRLLVPENKNIDFNDVVYGKISVNSKIIEDFIILRSNGLPTYNFSVAIDDILMKITHIIRGEDHLSNTPKQLLVYDALGIEPPIFTHLPMILGRDGQKLSKRHGSISIEAYREEGFLPEAILNYLALLGWAYDEKTTIFSLNELIDKFNLEAINKKPAKFDYDKLLWLNGSYIRNIDNKILELLIKDRIEKVINQNKKNNIVLENFKNTKDSEEYIASKISKIIPIIKIRIKTLKECDELISPFFLKIKYSEEIKSYFNNDKNNIITILNEVIILLSNLTSFISTEIEERLRLISRKLNINFRKIAEITRIAVWGSKISPPLFGTIEILGKKLTLERLRDYKDL